MRTLSLRSALLLAVVVGLIGCGVLFRGLLNSAPGEVLWADRYDARLLHWIAEWGYQVIFERRSPAEFWNAPSFYPHRGTLAYSDSLVSAQLFYAPLRLLGVSSHAALYITLGWISVMGCILSALALKRIGGFSAGEAAIILYAAHFGLSITAYLHHYQLFGFQLAAPFFLFLYLYLRDWRVADLIGVSFCFVFGVCLATYLAPMLVTLALLVSLPAILKIAATEGVVAFGRRVGVLGAMLFTVAAVFVFAVQLAPYLKVEQQLAPQQFSESTLYSANLTSYLWPARGGNSLWYGPSEQSARFGDAERAFFPGFVLLVLSSGFMLRRISWPRVASRFTEAPDAGLDPGLLRYFAALLGGALVLALGPYLHGHTAFKLPFYFLSEIIPGLERVRAPGRFGIFVSLPVACFAVCLFRCVCQNRYRAVSLVCCGLLMFIETLPRSVAYPYSFSDSGLYQEVAKLLPADAPLVELPVAGKDSLATIVRITDQLQGTLIHGGRIMLGYGAKDSPEAQELGHLDLKLQRGKAGPQDLMAFCERFRISHILLRLNRYPPALRRAWAEYVRTSPRVKVQYRTDQEIFLQVIASQ